MRRLFVPNRMSSYRRWQLHSSSQLNSIPCARSESQCPQCSIHTAHLFSQASKTQNSSQRQEDFEAWAFDHVHTPPSPLVEAGKQTVSCRRDVQHILLMLTYPSPASLLPQIFTKPQLWHNYDQYVMKYNWSDDWCNMLTPCICGRYQTHQKNSRTARLGPASSSSHKPTHFLLALSCTKCNQTCPKNRSATKALCNLPKANHHIQHYRRHKAKQMLCRQIPASYIESKWTFCKIYWITEMGVPAQWSITPSHLFQTRDIMPLPN